MHHESVSSNARVAALSLVAGLLLAVGFAADAAAWTVTRTGGTLQVDAAAGEINDLTVASDPGGFRFTDSALVASAVPGDCTVDDADVVQCPASSALVVRLGDQSDLASIDVPAAVDADAGLGDDQLTVNAAGTATITGGDGDDDLQGGSATDTIDGGAGSDAVRGGAMADTLLGGTGDDDLSGDDGTDTLDGGDGSDSLDGGSDADLLRGASGDDRADGGDGPDTISGGDGDDELLGGAGADTIGGDAGQDSIEGNDGNDTLGDAAGGALLDGGAGDDLLTGSGAADQLDGSDGNDRLAAGAGDDLLDGGDGDDQLAAGDGTDQVEGGPGADHLDGSDGSDAAAGGTGADVIHGGAGNDDLGGDEGDDDLHGDDGNDTVDGGAGRDRTSGDAGDDLLTLIEAGTADGGDGTDTLVGSPGDDTLVGGAGNDLIFGGAGDDILAGGPGNDDLRPETGAGSTDGGGDDDLIAGITGSGTLAGGSGIDTLTYADASASVSVSLGAGADDGLPGQRADAAADFEVVLGSPFGDVLRSGAQPARLEGGDGPDALNGGSAADTLLGGPGNDILSGAAGPDVLDGEADDDTVSYASRTAPVLVDLDAPGIDGEAGENDAVSPATETVIGGAAADRLSGSAGVRNVLIGGGGDDQLLATADDGFIDELRCGQGIDLTSTTPIDLIARDCETWFVDGTLHRGGPKAQPRVTLVRKRLTVVDGDVVRIPIHCASVTWGRCRGTVTLKLTNSWRKRVLGRMRFSLAAGLDRSIRVRLASDEVAWLRDKRHAAPRYRVEVEAQDDRRNRSLAAFPVSFRMAAKS